MTTIDKLKWRYATKKFNPIKQLANEKLDILKESFNLTATSFGLQTISLVVIKDKSIRSKLVEHSFNQKQVLDASHLLIICIQDDISDKDVDSYFDNVRVTRDTPETILSPYRNDLKKMMKEMNVVQRQEWSTKQAYIALGNLMTVCAIEQIDACPMEGFIPEKYDKILDFKSKKLKSILLLPVGYRADDDMFANLKKVRKELNETVLEM